jgi:hypothetical protein
VQGRARNPQNLSGKGLVVQLVVKNGRRHLTIMPQGCLKARDQEFPEVTPAKVTRRTIEALVNEGSDRCDPLPVLGGSPA